MNVESPKSEKTLMILNHVALSLSLSTMFIDTFKMVFVHHKEIPYSFVNYQILNKNYTTEKHKTQEKNLNQNSSKKLKT